MVGGLFRGNVRSDGFQHHIHRVFLGGRMLLVRSNLTFNPDAATQGFRFARRQIERVNMLRAVLFATIAFASIASQASEQIKCNPSGSQIEMNECAFEDFSKADKELNRTYQSVLKKEANDPLFIGKLRLAQQAWVAFRDAELEARFSCAERDVKLCWGSMYPSLLNYRKAELTRERTKQLKQILKEGLGQ